jgi:hypothetical protein
MIGCRLAVSGEVGPGRAHVQNSAATDKSHSVEDALVREPGARSTFQSRGGPRLAGANFRRSLQMCGEMRIWKSGPRRAQQDMCPKSQTEEVLDR